MAPPRSGGSNSKATCGRSLAFEATSTTGTPTQDPALCGQLVRRLSRHHTVEWCVLAVNGLDLPGLFKLLRDVPCARFDVVVLSMGASDATGLCAPLL